MLVTAAPAQAEGLSYNVFSGGIHAVNATLNIQEDDDKGRYKMVFTAATQGFLGKLAPWTGSFLSSGWVLKDGEFAPETHRSTAIWRGEEEVKTYSYGKDGGFKNLKVIEQGKDRTPKDLDLNIAKDTTDLLSAAMTMLASVENGEKCDHTDVVFDGERSFTITFRDVGTETLVANKYNTYSGPATMCEVEVTPKDGKWHKKPRGWLSIQEQGRKKGTLPVVWVAKLKGQPVAVPVKLRVASDYGTLFMHLTSKAVAAKQ